MAAKDKKGKNKGGRPRIDPEVTRVLIAFRVHPKTKDAIERIAKATKISSGALMDMYFQ